ncbi:MAG: hypothetical protein LBL96_02270 [Clostridiales bacterium]|jgi:antitoxin YefM|nr:hypothetical protein [Clostridiales bacterium]
MRAIRVNDFTRNCKEICDEAYSGSPVILSRPRNENVVVVAESDFITLTKARELLQREYILRELAQSEIEANDPKTKWLSHEEAWAMIEG